jgi:hypothetical protein
VNHQTPLAHKSTVISPFVSPFIPRFQTVNSLEQSNLSGVPTTQPTSTTAAQPTTNQATTPNPSVPGGSALPPSASAKLKYKVLIQVVNELSKSSDGFVKLNDIASSRWGTFWAGSGKLSKYLQAAAVANVVALKGKNSKIAVSLHPSLRIASTTSQKTQTTPSASNVSPVPVQQTPGNPLAQERARFQGLVQVIREMATKPTDYVDLSSVATRLKKLKNSGYEAAGFSRMKPFAEAAQALGLVLLRTKGSHVEICLRI